MKKNLFFVAAFAMALASCSNDEVVELTQSNAISFRTSLENASRGVITADNLDEFQVYSYIGQQEYFNDKVAPAAVNDRTIWETQSGIYYWPGSALNFLGYAPISVAPTVSSDGITKNGFTVGENADVDFIVAANLNNDGSSSESVQMNFKHALSQIVIKAQNSSKVYKVEIAGVKIANVNNKADFEYKPTETSTQYSADNNNLLSSDIWKNAEGEESYVVSLNSNVTLDNLTDNAAPTAKELANSLLLLPQDLQAWGTVKEEVAEGQEAGIDFAKGAYISVLCRIYTANSNAVQVFPKEANDHEYTAVGIDTKWEPGHKYIYTLNFFGNGGGAGQVEPNDEDDDKEDGDDDDGKNPGDPILGGPITFTVNVDEWATGTTGNTDFKADNSSTGE